MIDSKDHEAWSVHEWGPADAEHRALLLPGGLCSASSFDDMRIGLVATTPAGFAGVPPPNDLSMDGYARAGSALADRLGCDIVVGHSLGANFALEMAAAGDFAGR